MFDPRRLIRPRPGMSPLPDIEMPTTPPLVPTTTGPPGGVSMPMPARPTRQQEMDEARDVYAKGAPGRLKSGLLGALRGGLQGLATHGLAGALGGAVAGGGFGAISPQGLRKQRFEEEIAPQIRQRFAMEDQQAAQARQAQKDALDNEYRAAQTAALNRSNQPAPPKGPTYGNAPGIGIFNESTGQVTTPAPPQEQKKLSPEWRLGRNRRTGRFSYFNLNDPASVAEHDPAPPLQNPKAPSAAKAKKEPQYVSITKVREFAQREGISESEAKARAKQDGFTVVQ